MPRQYTRIPAPDRLWPKVEITETCWYWTGFTNRDGYGVLFTPEQRTAGTHRYAWWLATGKWPEPGQVVAHICDADLEPGDISYRRCVRNDDIGVYELDGVTYERRGHLWLGTNVANTRDRYLKGRSASGERHGWKTKPESLKRGDQSWAHLHPERLPRGDMNPSRRHPERLARGERHGMSVLTADLVIDIRLRYERGDRIAHIARDLGIGWTTASKVIQKLTWRHV